MPVGARKAGEEFGVIRTIINLGGQDSKAISLDNEGNVVNFAMNDRCAAGHRQIFRCSSSKARNWHRRAWKIITLNQQAFHSLLIALAQYFAESEIIGLLGNEHKAEDIVAGIHYSIAKRIIKLAKRVGIKDVIYFDGGPAFNKGLAAAIEDELGKELAIPKNPQIYYRFLELH